jgi:tRNA A37 N6-isopentenylltransferase MiaA
VPRVRDLLYRFRPTGTPGAAGAAAVPVDRRADLAAELQPLFSQLEETGRRCGEIVAQGRRDAAASRGHTQDRVRAVRSAAVQRAESERAAAAAQVEREAAQASATARLVAEREAAKVRERSAERMTDLVHAVTADVRALLASAPDRNGSQAGAR